MPRGLPVLVAENATLPQARRIALTLEELPEIARYGVTGPTLIMIGRAFGATLAAVEQEALRKFARA
jgi:siroheme synthase